MVVKINKPYIDEYLTRCRVNIPITTTNEYVVWCFSSISSCLTILTPHVSHQYTGVPNTCVFTTPPMFPLPHTAQGMLGYQRRAAMSVVSTRTRWLGVCAHDQFSNKMHVCILSYHTKCNVSVCFTVFYQFSILLMKLFNGNKVALLMFTSHMFQLKYKIQLLPTHVHK